MPVVKNGRITGYVTLALDHDHIRQFSDRLMPTEERYTPIADAIKGNYAFLWDYKSRAISHPRDYFIVGYDPQTGLPATPWMDEELYNEWQASGKPSHEFLAETPALPRPKPETQAGQGTGQGGQRWHSTAAISTSRRNATAGMRSPNTAAPARSSFSFPASGS
jgi:hypothetical protein